MAASTRGDGFKVSSIVNRKTGAGIYWTSAAPSNGTTLANVAGPGSILVSTNTNKAYINTNTKASPTWTVIGSQS